MYCTGMTTVHSVVCAENFTSKYPIGNCSRNTVNISCEILLAKYCRAKIAITNYRQQNITLEFEYNNGKLSAMVVRCT